MYINKFYIFEILDKFVVCKKTQTGVQTLGHKIIGNLIEPEALQNRKTSRGKTAANLSLNFIALFLTQDYRKTGRVAEKQEWFIRKSKLIFERFLEILELLPEKNRRAILYYAGIILMILNALLWLFLKL
jgi:hypothetical protein